MVYNHSVNRPQLTLVSGAGASGFSNRSTCSGVKPSSIILFFTACSGTPMRTILKYFA